MFLFKTKIALKMKMTKFEKKFVNRKKTDVNIKKIRQRPVP